MFLNLIICIRNLWWKKENKFPQMYISTVYTKYKQISYSYVTYTDTPTHFISQEKEVVDQNNWELIICYPSLPCSVMTWENVNICIVRDCIHATSNMSRLIMGDCNEHPDSQVFQVFQMRSNKQLQKLKIFIKMCNYSV